MLLQINSSYEKIDTKGMVPCNCRECAVSLTPHFYEYSYLVKCRKKGIKEVNCIKSVEDVPIEQLLSGIEIEKEETHYEWDVFISYSSKDFRIIKTIIEDLKKHRITYWWDDEQIKHGESIMPHIEKGLKGSRVVLACFSHNQLKSGWCRAEYEAVLEKVISGTTNQKVLPLILDDLTKDEMPILVSNRKFGRYSDKEEFNKILKELKLKKPFKTGK
jgi:hypothetical protein